MHQIKKWASFMANRHLLLTNTITSASIAGLADVAQQYINGDTEPNGWDWKRTMRMSAVGLLFGPVLHNFYRILDSRKFVGSANKVIFKKLCFDAAFTPVFSCYCMILACLFEGQSLSSAVQEFRSKMWHMWKVDFSIWPPAQFLNFYFLPKQARVIYINIVSFIYSCLMSHVKHNEVHVTNKDQ